MIAAMSMGRKRPGQPTLWVPHTAAAKAPGHAFYEKLNELLAEHDFDGVVEAICDPFYAGDARGGRPSIPPPRYFRMLLIGYFEGIGSERGICWRCEDSLSLRAFLGLELGDPIPDHSTLSRIRQRLDAEAYQEVFRFVLSMVEQKGLLRGKVVGVDSTYLRADASMKAIVRRDSGESYKEYLKSLAREAGIEEPTEEDARRIDRNRKKKTSNEEWVSETDPSAKITRLKDGRTRLAYKPETVVDLESGAILAAPVYAADQHDTATIEESLEQARRNVETVVDAANAESGKDDDDLPPPPAGAAEAEDDGNRSKVEVVADKGYHSAAVIVGLEEKGFRTYIPERLQKGTRRWDDKGGRETAEAVYRNRARTKRGKSKRLHRRRGELVERPFAHLCETGAARRTRLRGRVNVEKRWIIQAAAFNLGLILRTLLGYGTPRGLAAARGAAASFIALWFIMVAVARQTCTACARRWIGDTNSRQVSRWQPGGRLAGEQQRLNLCLSTGC